MEGSNVCNDSTYRAKLHSQQITYLRLSWLSSSRPVAMAPMVTVVEVNTSTDLYSSLCLLKCKCLFPLGPTIEFPSSLTTTILSNNSITSPQLKCDKASVL